MRVETVGDTVITYHNDGSKAFLDPITGRTTIIPPMKFMRVKPVPMPIIHTKENKPMSTEFTHLEVYVTEEELAAMRASRGDIGLDHSNVFHRLLETAPNYPEIVPGFVFEYPSRDPHYVSGDRYTVVNVGKTEAVIRPVPTHMAGSDGSLQILKVKKIRDDIARGLANEVADETLSIAEIISAQDDVETR